jgi:crotonobetainyl-CoA:carnitine CoA-transferase CaiB-like acyl-CoA transferase
VTTEATERLLQSDGFGRASGYVADVTHPTFDSHPRLAPVVRFSRSATQAKPGVLAGCATDAVLAELGYRDAEVADLRSRQIVG